MNEYEITIGVFIDANIYGDCESHKVKAHSVEGAYSAVLDINYRGLSKNKDVREIISIKRVN